MCLISGEELLKRFDNIPVMSGLGLEPVIAMRDVKEIIKAASKVEAVPVVHGKWIITGGMKPPEYHHHHQCSVCESYAPMRTPYGGREELSPYCPACGAKMDLGETK